MSFIPRISMGEICQFKLLKRLIMCWLKYLLNYFMQTMKMFFKFCVLLTNLANSCDIVFLFFNFLFFAFFWFVFFNKKKIFKFDLIVVQAMKKCEQLLSRNFISDSSLSFHDLAHPVFVTRSAASLKYSHQTYELSALKLKVAKSSKIFQ